MIAIRALTPVLVGTLIGTVAHAAPETFVVDPAHTFPTFEVSHLGFSFHRGRFNRTRGKVIFDATGERGAIDITIDADSLDTGDPALEAELRGAKFFDVERHPQLRFRADALVFRDQRLVGANGSLTLLGKTGPVSLRVTHFHCATNLLTHKYTCGANVEATIQRSDFGMNSYIPFVGDDVRITIQLEAQREEPGAQPDAQ